MQTLSHFPRVFSKHALLLLLAYPFLACAQANYPSRPVRLIVPYPPGGSTDITGRLVAQHLTGSWGQQTVVDNRGGGNTIVGSETLVRSAPDGYTIMLVTSAHTIIPNLIKTPYDPVRDFVPVATVIATQQVMVVNPGVPANSLKEFIALAKSKAGQINYGASGTGTNNHLSAELFSMMTGVKMQHVPYKGAGPALTDLVAGQIQMFMNNPLPLASFVKSGRLRALAISGDKRLPSLPEVPTFTEAGLPGFQASGWQGILVPRRAPAAIVDKLSQEITRMLRAREVIDTIVTVGAEPFISTPEQFTQLIKTELDRNAAIIKHANIKPE